MSLLIYGFQIVLIELINIEENHVFPVAYTNMPVNAVF